MKVGDCLKFKRVKWVLTEKKFSFPAMVEYWQYRSYRKYFGIWLKYTNQTYCIFPRRWKELEKYVRENGNFYPSQLYYLSNKKVNAKMYKVQKAQKN